MIALIIQLNFNLILLKVYKRIIPLVPEIAENFNSFEKQGTIA